LRQLQFLLSPIDHIRALDTENNRCCVCHLGAHIGLFAAAKLNWRAALATLNRVAILCRLIVSRGFVLVVWVLGKVINVMVPRYSGAASEVLIVAYLARKPHLFAAGTKRTAHHHETAGDTHNALRNDRRGTLLPIPQPPLPLTPPPKVRPGRLSEVREIAKTAGTIILRSSGVVRGFTNWGTFLLPKPAKKLQTTHQYGHHFIMRFDASARAQHTLRKTMGLDPRLIRYSVVKMGEKFEAIKDVEGGARFK